MSEKQKSALIVVDVQNDFISGTLSISKCPSKHNGEEVVPVINKLLKSCSFDLVVYSKDWHPADHISFYENRFNRKLHPTSSKTAQDANHLDAVVFEVTWNNEAVAMEQILWPAHCIQDSWGSQLHKDLVVADGACVVTKGSNSDVDSYSAFFDNRRLSRTDLIPILRQNNITHCFVCGIAYDVCVGSTAKHAIELGFTTYLIDDASRGVSEDDIAAMRRHLKANGGFIVSSDDVAQLLDAIRQAPLADNHKQLFASLDKY